MSLFQKILKISAESELQDTAICLSVLGREEMGILSEEDLEKYDAFCKRRAEYRRLQEDEEYRRKIENGWVNPAIVEYNRVVEANRALFASMVLEKRNTTKTLIDSLLTWTPSKYGHRKQDVINDILNWKSKDKGQLYYCAGTYTETRRRLPHALAVGVYFDYKTGIIAKCKGAGDAHDFEIHEIQRADIIEAYQLQ